MIDVNIESDELVCETLKSYEIDVIYHNDMNNLPDLKQNASINNYLIYLQYYIKKFLSLNKLYNSLENLDLSAEQEEDISEFFQKTIEYNKKIAEVYRNEFLNSILNDLAKLDINILNQYKVQINLLNNKYFGLIKDFEEKSNDLLDDLIAKIEAEQEKTDILNYETANLHDIYYIYENRYNIFVRVKIIKKNQKTAIARLLDADIIKKYSYKTEVKCSYSLLNRNPEEYKKKIEDHKNFTFTKSKIYTDEDLKRLMEETKVEYKSTFNSIFNSIDNILLNSVKINWGTRVIIFSQAGYYNHQENRIQISASLKFTPEFVIKSVIFHELLHIHFHCHGSQFRSYEKMFKQYNEANQFIHKLFMKIRLEQNR